MRQHVAYIVVYIFFVSLNELQIVKLAFYSKDEMLLDEKEKKNVFFNIIVFILYIKSERGLDFFFNIFVYISILNYLEPKIQSQIHISINKRDKKNELQQINIITSIDGTFQLHLF